MNKIKIGICCICLNPPYWEYANEMLWGLNTFFLKHPSIKEKYDVKLLLWSDIPTEPQIIGDKISQYMAMRGEVRSSVISPTEVRLLWDKDQEKNVGKLIDEIVAIRQRGATIFETEPVEWPLPTLLRYNLFLQQEEKIKDFDYLFYIDVDMRITDWIGEEILGEGLTAAQHPMYALKQNLIAPYEDNPNSSAYIPRPGRLLEENGKTRFQPLYYAGGFQGGRTEEFIKAMKVMRDRIDKDFSNNYIAKWNDESHWNRYLFEVPPVVALNPSYIYPDSLIAEYYVKQIWGRNFSPKIMTLTKKFSTTKEGGEAVSKLLAL